MPKSPDFSQKTIDILAKRAAHLCSSPGCYKKTSGAHSEETKAVILGEAAHIRGARPKSPRYDPSMTNEERSHISNGIWLCVGCARGIDKDPIKFDVKLLYIWKECHERRVRETITPYGDEELRRENEELRQQLNFKENFERKYEYKVTPGGARVFESRENPGQYSCPSCVNKQEEQFLQDELCYDGTFICPGCKNTYPINQARQFQQQQKYAKGRLGSQGWMR